MNNLLFILCVMYREFGKLPIVCVVFFVSDILLLRKARKKNVFSHTPILILLELNYDEKSVWKLIETLPDHGSQQSWFQLNFAKPSIAQSTIRLDQQHS